MSTQPVYRRVENRFLKINPDGSVIEVNFDLMSCDACITVTRRPGVKLPETSFYCYKREFEKALKTANDIIKTIRNNQSGQVQMLLSELEREVGA
jgi:hypothetical protein